MRTEPTKVIGFILFASHLRWNLSCSHSICWQQQGFPSRFAHSSVQFTEKDPNGDNERRSEKSEFKRELRNQQKALTTVANSLTGNLSLAALWWRRGAEYSRLTTSGNAKNLFVFDSGTEDY